MKKGRKVLLILPITMLSIFLLYMPVSATEEQNIQENTENQQQQEQENPPVEEHEEEQEEQEEQPAPTPRRTTRKRTTTQEQTEEQQENNEENEASTQEGKYTLTLLSNGNMRAEASTDSVSKVVVPFGIKITSDERITNENGEVWYRVSYGGAVGYIREDLVNVEESAAEQQETSEEDEESEEGENEEKSSADNSQNALSKTYTPKKSSQETSQTEEKNNVEDKDLTQEIVTSEAPIVNRRKIDAVFLLFMGGSALGFILAVITGGKLVNEYQKRKAYVIKYSEDKELFIDMDKEITD